jgi:hypothetical protein
MADGFASGYAFAIEDAVSGQQVIGAIYAARDGADNTGKLSFHVASAGSLAERMGLTAAGLLSISGDLSLGADGGADRSAFIYSDTAGSYLQILAAGGASAVYAFGSGNDLYVRSISGEVIIIAGTPTSDPENMYFRCGAAVYWQDYDAGNATRMTLATATGDLNVTGHYQVDGTQVVGNQQAAIADLADGGAASDGTCRSKVNDMLAALRAHGLIAT